MGREQRYVPYRRVKNPTEVVVIFKTHLRDGADSEAYRKTSRRMHELVEQISGYISIKAYTGEDGDEIDLVRFANEGALNAWKEQPDRRGGGGRRGGRVRDVGSSVGARLVRPWCGALGRAG